MQLTQQAAKSFCEDRQRFLRRRLREVLPEGDDSIAQLDE
jgi:hypothetical protein